MRRSGRDASRSERHQAPPLAKRANNNSSCYHPYPVKSPKKLLLTPSKEELKVFPKRKWESKRRVSGGRFTLTVSAFHVREVVRFLRCFFRFYKSSAIYPYMLKVKQTLFLLRKSTVLREIFTQCIMRWGSCLICSLRVTYLFGGLICRAEWFEPADHVSRARAQTQQNRNTLSKTHWQVKSIPYLVLQIFTETFIVYSQAELRELPAVPIMHIFDRLSVTRLSHEELIMIWK